nr:retrovirus-related Pol polyprotein from transposon TNT 1-94 [Tanacetum cinerariifolium]
MIPFGCPVTILNTLDPLGKFDGKADEGFLVRYSVTSKAFRVFNRSIPKWLFDIDTLTQSINYQPVVTGNQPNPSANADAAFDVKEPENEVYVSLSSSDKPKKNDEKAKREAKGKSLVDLSTGVRVLSNESKEFSVNSTNRVNVASAIVTVVGQNPTNSTNSFNTVGPSDNVVSLNFEICGKSSFVDPSPYLDDPDMRALEDIVYLDAEEDVGV